MANADKLNTLLILISEKKGDEFEKSINYNLGKVGTADSHLVNMNKVVDFAVTWPKINRKY